MEFLYDKFNILQGNVVEVIKSLPDESVQTCITSPPYYGLRDYGTGHWVGGDPNCNHYRDTKYSEDTITGHKHMMDTGNAVGDAIYKSVCPKCGAIRVDDQIGLEETPEKYVATLVQVFHEVKRILKKDGTLWVNIGDTYNTSSYRKDEKSSGHGKQGTNRGSYENVVERPMDKNSKVKDLMGIPWMLAFALRNDGWYLRQDIIWDKPNSMPEPVTDRCTKSHEYMFLMSKSPKYYFDNEAIKEEATGYDGRKDTFMKGSVKYKNSNIMPNGKPNTLSVSGHERWEFKNGVPMRNKRDVWHVPVNSYSEAHFATFPPKLIEPCILAGSKPGDIILDPFSGSGTTGEVAMLNKRKYIGIELNEEYINLSMKRLMPIAKQRNLF